MKKIIFLALISVGVMIFSCAFVRKGEDKNSLEEPVAFLEKDPEKKSSEDQIGIEKPKSADKDLVKNVVPETRPIEIEKPKTDHEDKKPEANKAPETRPMPSSAEELKKLDEKVIEEAKKIIGQDPKKYRMFYRDNPVGQEVYRMVGMFVIINPNGEEFYLPDEI